MLKIGHRGASGFAPENTLTGFKKAMETGADGIELDIQRCQSGELMVIHDDTVNRTTNGTGKVADMTFGQLRALRIDNHESIPTLEEVLEALGPDVYYFIEVKHADAALPAAKLLDHYRGKGWQPKKFMLISFVHTALAEALRTFPSLQVGASFDQVTQDSVKRAEILGASAILPNYRNFKETHMRQADKVGLDVIAWTINDRLDIDRTRLMGVQGIISDYPDRLVSGG